MAIMINDKWYLIGVSTFDLELYSFHVGKKYLQCLLTIVYLNNTHFKFKFHSI